MLPPGRSPLRDVCTRWGGQEHGPKPEGRVEAACWRVYTASCSDPDGGRLVSTSPARGMSARRARPAKVPAGDIEAAARAPASAITVTGTVLSHTTAEVAGAVVNAYWRTPGGLTLAGSGISDKSGQYHLRIAAAAGDG